MTPSTAGGAVRRLHRVNLLHLSPACVSGCDTRRPTVAVIQTQLQVYQAVGFRRPSGTGGALGVGGPRSPGRLRETALKQQREHREEQEPVGIVIAGGARGDVTPRFAAFVWGPAPDAVEFEREAKAA